VGWHGDTADNIQGRVPGDGGPPKYFFVPAALKLRVLMCPRARALRDAALSKSTASVWSRSPERDEDHPDSCGRHPRHGLRSTRLRRSGAGSKKSPALFAGPSKRITPPLRTRAERRPARW